MNYTMMGDVLESLDLPSSLEARSVYQALQQLQDGRARRGVRYSVALVLTLIILGKLVGMTTPEAISEWVQLRADWLRQMVPNPRRSFPCTSTYRNILRGVDAEHVRAVLSDVLIRATAQKRCGDEPSRLVGQPQAQKHAHVALDGKTVRGTLHHLAADQPRVHQLSLYEAQTGIVLAEVVMQEKENEISCAKPLLCPLWLKGRIISADAMQTYTGFCAEVRASGGDYLLIAKGNQPTLLQDLKDFFQDPPWDCRDWRVAHTCNSGHGRLEQREINASTELNEWLASDWPGVAQVFRVRRRRTNARYCTQEWVYGISSLSPAQASPQRLLDLLRSHWAIENRLHYRRDVTLREDHCQVRKGAAPRVLANLNSFVLGLLDLKEVSNVARQMRIFDAQPLEALRLLFEAL